MIILVLEMRYWTGPSPCSQVQMELTHGAGRVSSGAGLAWALQVAVFQIIPPSSHCDNQNHFCTFLNTVVDPLSGKWTIWIYHYVGDMGTLAMHCILSSSLRIHSIANRRDGSIKGYHWHWYKFWKQNYITINFLSTCIGTLETNWSKLSYVFLKSVLSSLSAFSLPLFRAPLSSYLLLLLPTPPNKSACLPSSSIPTLKWKRNPA